MKMLDRIKKLIRDSNPMTKKITFVEKCLNGGCYNVKKDLDLLLQTIPYEETLQEELGLNNEEYQTFVKSDDFYIKFQEILINRIVDKNK